MVTYFRTSRKQAVYDAIQQADIEVLAEVKNSLIKSIME
jgi:hypothetical protein